MHAWLLVTQPRERRESRAAIEDMSTARMLTTLVLVDAINSTRNALSGPQAQHRDEGPDAVLPASH